MAENDIYNSKGKYETFIKNLDNLITIPEKDSHRKYYCKNKVNLNYYKILIKKFEAKDLSYVRRCRLLYSMNIVTCATNKDLVKAITSAMPGGLEGTLTDKDGKIEALIRTISNGEARAVTEKNNGTPPNAR